MCQNFFDSRTLPTVSSLDSRYCSLAYLFLFEAVFEDVLDDQTSSLSQSYLVPHAAERFIHPSHDLRGLAIPTQLKQFLPYMARVAMNDSLGNPPQELVNHAGLVLLRHAVKCFLDDMTAERIHTEVNCVALDCVCNCHHLLRRAMFKATLNQEVSKPVDHELVGIVNNSLDDVVLLLRSSDFWDIEFKSYCIWI